MTEEQSFDQIINVRETGYWLSKEYMYLDILEFETDLNLENYSCFIHEYGYKTKHNGNNPFTKSECYRYSFDETGYVEVMFFGDKMDLAIVLSESYSTSADLLIALGNLQKLYAIVKKHVEKQIKEYEEYDEET